MSFPVIRPVSRPRIRKILFSTKCFLLDEFSSKTACVVPQNSPIDDWMSFPVIRSGSFPRNLTIRVKRFLAESLEVSNKFNPNFFSQLVKAADEGKSK